MSSNFGHMPTRIDHRDCGFFNVVSYNLHGETHGWGPDRFEEKDYTDSLSRWDADVYVLPETWGGETSSDGTSTEKKINDFSYVKQWVFQNDLNMCQARANDCTPRHPKMKMNGDAEVSIVTPHPIKEVRHFRFTNHKKDSSNNRNCVAALIDIPNHGKIWVLGVHFSANILQGPLSNLKDLRVFITQLEETKHPVIVAGDFNLWGWWIKALLGKPYRRAVKGRTWPSWKPHSQIDHILIPKEIILHNSFVANKGHSDHRAIYAEMKRSNWEDMTPYKIYPTENVINTNTNNK